MLQLHCPLLSSWHTWEKIMSVKTEAKRPLSTLPSVNLLSVFAITFLCSTVLSSLPFQLKPEDSEMPEAFHFPFHCLHCTVMNYQRQYQPQGNTLTLFSWRNTVPGSWIPAKLESWCWFGNSWTTNLVLQFASHVTRLWGKMSDTARSRMYINKNVEGHHHHLWTLCKGEMWAEWILLHSSHAFVNICPRGLRGPIVLFSETSFIIFYRPFLSNSTEFKFSAVTVFLIPPEGQVC